MRRELWLVGFVTLGLASCYVYSYPPYYYSSGYYGPYYYATDGWLTYSWMDSTGGVVFPSVRAQANVVDLNAVASTMASQAGNAYAPAGCASAVANGSTVTYTFTNCAGHFGVGTISGSTTVNLSEPSGQLVLTTRSHDLTLDGKPAVLDFTATMSSSGLQRTIAIDSRSYRPDQVNARHSQGTLTWQQGSGCIGITGSGTITRGSDSATVKIDALQRCEGQCPSDGTVTVTGGKGTFQGRFNGTDTETVTDSNGRRKDFTIVCD